MTLSADEEAEYLALLEAERLHRIRRDLHAYCRYIDIPGVPVSADEDCEVFYPDRITPAAHHDLINAALMRLADPHSGIDTLLVCMPPGSAKSSYGAVTFPTWYLGNHPGEPIICASYGSDLARKFGRRCRAIVQSAKFRALFGAGLVPDNRAADDWALSNGGSYMAGGILAGMTGNRAKCFPGETLISTENGQQRIDSLYEAGFAGYVLSYDAHTDSVVRRRVKALARREAQALYRVRTADGGVVDCTGDHRLYTERGYVEARLLSPDDRLLRLVPADGEAQRLPDEKGREGRAEGDLLRTPLPTKGGQRGSREARQVLPNLRREGFGQHAGWRKDGHLLLGDLQAGSEGRKSESPHLRHAGAPLRGVQHHIQAEKPAPAGALLLAPLQGPRPRDADVRREESGLAQRGESCPPGRAQREGLSGGEAAHHPQGRGGLRRLLGNDTTARAPHRHERSEQRLAQPGYAVLGLPHDAARSRAFTTAPAAVALVERLREPAVVYDLQVEGTECFFANGILAHNCLIIDDPIKGREDADSPTMRQKTWDAYQDDLLTRLKPGGKQLIIGTRWHEDDLMGRLLPETWDGESGPVTGRTGERLHVLCLEAECTRTDDPLGRQIGEFLWPDWFPAARWQQEKARGSRRWASLYQQRPKPAEGALIQRAWVQRYRSPPAPALVLRTVQSWDTAYKDSQLNDPAVCTTWAETRQGWYLLHVHRARMQYPALKRAVASLAEQWRPHAILIEDKSSGQSLIQELRGQFTQPVIALTPEGSKLDRLVAVSALFESGLVHLPEHAPWLVDYEAELFGYPLTTHDDQIDSTSQALQWMSRHAGRYQHHASGQTRAALGADTPPTRNLTGFF